MTVEEKAQLQKHLEDLVKYAESIRKKPAYKADYDAAGIRIAQLQYLLMTS